MTGDLHATKRAILDTLGDGPKTIAALEDATGKSSSTIKEHIYDLQEEYAIDYDRAENHWVLDDLEAEDDREDLTDRENYIYRSLPASAGEIADDLGIAEPVAAAHLDVIDEKGWPVESDDEGNYLGLDSYQLRNSEHKTTRTRKANRWWQERHDALVHEFKRLEWPSAPLYAFDGNEDWVLHLTDIHAGDLVRLDDGRVVYDIETIPDIVDYVTDKSLALAEKHGSDYDTAHLLWGGDYITNEGIYESQYEDLDAWLDEQHDALVDPLVRQVKEFADRFPAVQIVCQVGNHGQHRASGVSKQANADLVLYKTIRNTLAQIRKHSDDPLFENVQMLIGEARPFRDFEMREGELTGHLRHGQNRKPQAVTRAGSDDWRGTLIDHEFDVAYMGHFHISGRVPWDGPPIIVSASPKPAGDYVETLGGRIADERRDIATAHGVSDDGLTGVYPIDTRDFHA